jgi:hypothetical protein
MDLWTCPLVALNASLHVVVVKGYETSTYTERCYFQTSFFLPPSPLGMKQCKENSSVSPISTSHLFHSRTVAMGLTTVPWRRPMGSEES